MHKICDELGIYFDGLFLHRKEPYFAASYHRCLGFHIIDVYDGEYRCWEDELTKEWVLSVMDGKIPLTKRTNNNED
jgi:hypothetical protein